MTVNLSAEQLKAVNHINGPALVLAVPGAGKTTVLIHRTKKLLEKGVDPSKILSITFSKASATDMKSRFQRSFPELFNIPIKFLTIHSFCFSLIREYAEISKTSFRLIEDDTNPMNKYTLLKKLYLDINKEYITEEKLESLLNSIGYIKNMMMPVEEYAKNNKEIDKFVDIYNSYEAFKKENNMIDFDDMLSISLEILSKNKFLLNKYRKKYNYIQLDEGQDTSKLQLEIIKLLAKPENNIFIVADDDQSIYGFRGAFPKGLLNFQNMYSDGKLFFMEKNYRSTKNIVSICNAFIKTNTLRYKKEISTDNKYLEPVNLIKVKSIEDQYNILLEELGDKDLSKCCILYRNNLSSVGVMEVLEKNNIEFYARDTKLRFFNHWVLNDILSFLNFAQDTTLIDIYENIYYKTKGYISKKHINFAKTLDYRMTVFDRILEYPGINDFYRRNLRDLKYDFKRLTVLKPKAAIKYIEEDMEYGEYLKENATKFGYTYDTLKTIIFYLKLIAKDCEDLSQFVERLNHLKYLASNSNRNKNVITLSTIHSAKGLEFDHVYMIDLVEGDFPSISSMEAFEKGDIEPIEEERRLFYVGMTRAKSHLTLITMSNIEDKQMEPSRFLWELEQNCKKHV